MQIAIIGLGRMGGNMVKRLLGGGHKVVACDRDPASTERRVEEGATGAASLGRGGLIDRSCAPRS